MAIKFQVELGHIDFVSLNVFRQSPQADKVRADMILAGRKIRAPKLAQVVDKKMHLHRLKCGQCIIIPFVNDFNYKDALKFTVRYYNTKSHCFYAVIKHAKNEIFEIARIF